jgi:hypothetical protein
MRKQIFVPVFLASLAVPGAASADRDDTARSLDRAPAVRQLGAVVLSVGETDDPALAVIANDPSIRILAVEVIERDGDAVRVRGGDYQVLELGELPDAERVAIAYVNPRPSRDDEIVLVSDLDDDDTDAPVEERYLDWYHFDKWDAD